jgi:hypothetical protein
MCFDRLFGCYEALDGGDLAEALEDFTGGVSEACNLIEEKKVGDEAQREQFYEWLIRAAENNAVMCAAIPVGDLFDCIRSSFICPYVYSFFNSCTYRSVCCDLINRLLAKQLNVLAPHERTTLQAGR